MRTTEKRIPAKVTVNRARSWTRLRQASTTEMRGRQQEGHQRPGRAVDVDVELVQGLSATMRGTVRTPVSSCAIGSRAKQRFIFLILHVLCGRVLASCQVLSPAAA